MADIKSAGLEPLGIERLGADTQPGEQRRPPAPSAPVKAPPRAVAHTTPPIETEPEEPHQLDELA